MVSISLVKFVSCTPRNNADIAVVHSKRFTLMIVIVLLRLLLLLYIHLMPILFLKIIIFSESYMSYLANISVILEPTSYFILKITINWVNAM